MVLAIHLCLERIIAGITVKPTNYIALHIIFTASQTSNIPAAIRIGTGMSRSPGEFDCVSQPWHLVMDVCFARACGV
jgi:hypothetical protein